MSNPDYTRIFIHSGTADAVVRDSAQVAGIINANYQPDGRLRPEVAQSLMPVSELVWPVVGALAAGQLTQRIQLGMPKQLERLGAYVMTAPTGGNLVLTLTGQSPTRALFDIASVTIRVNENYGEIVIPSQSISAGIYLGVRIGTANSASGLSLTAALRGEA